MSFDRNGFTVMVFAFTLFSAASLATAKRVDLRPETQEPKTKVTITQKSGASRGPSSVVPSKQPVNPLLESTRAPASMGKGTKAGNCDRTSDAPGMGEQCTTSIFSF